MSIAEQVGAPRIVPTRGIPYPAGDPSLDVRDERRWRGQLLGAAADALTTGVTSPTVFPADGQDAP